MITILALMAACSVTPEQLPAPPPFFQAIVAAESRGGELSATIGGERHDYHSVEDAIAQIQHADQPAHFGLFGVSTRWISRPLKPTDFDRCEQLHAEMEIVKKAKEKCVGTADGDAYYCLASWIGSIDGSKPNDAYAEQIVQQILLAEVSTTAPKNSMLVPLHVVPVDPADQILVPLSATMKPIDTGLFPERGIPKDLKDDARAMGAR